MLKLTLVVIFLGDSDTMLYFFLLKSIDECLGERLIAVGI